MLCCLLLNSRRLLHRSANGCRPFFKDRSTRISKAIFVASTFPKAPQPSEEIIQIANRTRLAEIFGWEFEYIDALDPFTLCGIWGYLDGKGKAKEWADQKAASKQKNQGRRGRRRGRR